MKSIFDRHRYHHDHATKPPSGDNNKLLSSNNSAQQQPTLPPLQQLQQHQPPPVTMAMTHKLPRPANWCAADRMNAAKQRATRSSSLDIAPPELMRLEPARNPLADHRDVLQLTLDFAWKEGFLFVASVSKRWREAWCERPTETSMKSAVQSASRLAWAKDGGCRWDVLTCARAAGELNLCVPAPVLFEASFTTFILFG